MLAGPVPATVLRATQFHEFVPMAAKMLSAGPVLLLPKGLRSQLVDLRDVSERLADAGRRRSGRAGGGPGGSGGPATSATR